MLVKRIAAVLTGVGLAVSLSGTPASADSWSTGFQNSAGAKACLDYNNDYGVWVFSCNLGSYQKWRWDNEDEYTAMRQRATGLCLTVRNGTLAMKPCAAADKAAIWQISSSDPAGRTIHNTLTGKCLARMKNDRVNLTTCTGGPSQRWLVRIV